MGTKIIAHTIGVTGDTPNFSKLHPFCLKRTIFATCLGVNRGIPPYYHKDPSNPRIELPYLVKQKDKNAESAHTSWRNSTMNYLRPQLKASSFYPVDRRSLVGGG